MVPKILSQSALFFIQVAGEFKLLQTLKELLGDAETLGACQRAAKDAFSIMSHGVVNRVWNLVCRFAIDFQIDTWNSWFSRALRGMLMEPIFPPDSTIIAVHHIIAVDLLQSCRDSEEGKCTWRQLHRWMRHAGASGGLLSGDEGHEPQIRPLHSPEPNSIALSSTRFAPLRN